WRRPPSSPTTPPASWSPRSAPPRPPPTSFAPPCDNGASGRVLKDGTRGVRGRGAGRGAPPVAFGSVAWNGARSPDRLGRDLRWKWREVRGLRSGDLLEGDLVAEGLNLTDEAARLVLARVAAAEVVRTEIVVGLAAVEDVIGGDQDGVADGDGRLGGAAARAQPGVLRAQVGGLGAARRLGCLRERRPQPLRALARRPGAAPPSGRMVAGAHAGPRGEAGRGPKAAHVDPDLGDEGFGGAAVNARDRPPERRRLRERGEHLLDLRRQLGQGLVEKLQLGEHRP